MSAARQAAAIESIALKPRRGPVNKTMVHWEAPKPVLDEDRNKRWQFKCKYCERCAASLCLLLLYLK